MLARLVNLALYQIGWFGCVLGAANGRPWLGAALAGALLLVHVALVRERGREIGLLLAAALIGGALDSLQSCSGLLRFRSGHVVGCLAPPWIVLMWMQFATLLRFSLAFLAGRPLLAGLLGAVGGPLAFGVGERMGAVQFASPAWHSLLALAAVWGVVFPLLLRLSVSRSGGSSGYRGLD